MTTSQLYCAVFIIKFYLLLLFLFTRSLLLSIASLILKINERLSQSVTLLLRQQIVLFYALNTH